MKKINKRDIKEIIKLEHDSLMGHSLIEINGKKYIGESAFSEEDDFNGGYKYIEITDDEIKKIEKELEHFTNKVYAKIDFKLLLREALKSHMEIKDVRKANKILDNDNKAEIVSKEGCYNLIIGRGKNKVDIHMF